MPPNTSPKYCLFQRPLKILRDTMISSEKMKSLSSKSTDLENQALHNLLRKPVVNSLAQWKKAGSDIKELADCLFAYSQYFGNQTEIMKNYH